MAESRYRRYIFWVNILSFHLSAFIRELAKDHEVWFAYEQNLPDHLSANGWVVPDFGNANLADVRDTEVRDLLLSNTDDGTCHCFGNYLNLPIANHAYHKLRTHNCGKVWISEPFNFQGIRGWVRTNRVRYHAFRNAASSIDLVFGMGELGVNFFRSAWIPQRKLREFVYCVEPKVAKTSEQNAWFTMLFVGQLIKRKGVDLLLQALSMIEAPNWRLELIGEGVSGKQFQALATRLGIDDRVEFLGPQPNLIATDYIAAADVLVLPSRWDGWGAVVNESLMAGTPAIVSDRCGASVLVTSNDLNGGVFQASSVRSLAVSLSRAIQSGRRTPEQRDALRTWASDAVSGKTVASYFVACCNGSEVVPPPWRA